jgi:hypothetical protein
MPRDKAYGFQRSSFGVYIPIPAGTGAAEIVTDWVAGFRFVIEKVRAYVAVVGAGAGATRTLRVLKGASTVVATGTVTLASTDTLGEEQSLTVTAANASYEDTDVLTVDFASGGTAFTAGALNLFVLYRSRLQGER